MIDLTTLTDDEARDLLARVYADVQRRDLGTPAADIPPFPASPHKETP